MDIEKVAKLLRDRSRVVSMKINPELLKLLDETLKEDKEYSSRNEKKKENYDGKGRFKGIR